MRALYGDMVMTIAKDKVTAALCCADAELTSDRRRLGLNVVLQKVGAVAEAIAALLVLSLAVLIGYEVVARYVFGRPTGFANQAAAYAMPVIAFFAAGAALKRNAHVAVDALTNAVSLRTKRCFAVVAESLGLVAVVGLTYAAFLEVIDNYESGTRSFSTVLTFPEYLPQIAMPVGLLILVGFQLLNLIHALREQLGARNDCPHHKRVDG